jgi:hypothetical protein
MPHFYLHVRNAVASANDEEGEDFADLAAAREKATAGARSILSEEVKGGLLDLRGAIDIADRTGKIVLTIPYTETVTVLTDDGSHG